MPKKHEGAFYPAMQSPDKSDINKLTFFIVQV